VEKYQDSPFVSRRRDDWMRHVAKEKDGYLARLLQQSETEGSKRQR